jgi:integrase
MIPARHAQVSDSASNRVPTSGTSRDAGLSNRIRDLQSECRFSLSRTVQPYPARNRCTAPRFPHRIPHAIPHDRGRCVAYLRKHRQGWRAEVERQGIRKTAVWPTRAAAKAWAEKVEAEIAAGKIVDGRTFTEAADRYLREVMPRKRGATRETFRLKAIMEHFGSRPLAELDAPDMAGWRDKRLAEVSTWSVLREAGILKSLLRIARDEWRWMEQDPFKGVRMPKDPPPRHQRWGWREIRRVLRFLGYQRGRAPSTKYQEVALAFVIALSTALRAGEVLQVAPSRIRNGALALESTKTEGYVRVPLTRRGARYCGLIDKWSIDGASLDALFRKAMAAALVDDLRFHDTRASALTWLARKVDVLTLARISRHKDLRILQNVYVRETAEEIAKRLK